tara:strand:+ start:8799 stop:9308 length:510 start_codon:yes stop_codon:yes gene_type:complete
MILALSTNLFTAAVIIVLLANVAVLYSTLETAEGGSGEGAGDGAGKGDSADAGKGAGADDGSNLVSADGIDTTEPYPYGPSQAEYDSYVTTYSPNIYNAPGYDTPIAIVSPSERDLSMDNVAMDIARRRTRDKAVMDGRAVKDAHFYKHHFTDELEKEEAKPWWGRNDW